MLIAGRMSIISTIKIDTLICQHICIKYYCSKEVSWENEESNNRYKSLDDLLL